MLNQKNNGPFDYYGIKLKKRKGNEKGQNVSKTDGLSDSVNILERNKHSSKASKTNPYFFHNQSVRPQTQYGYKKSSSYSKRYKSTKEL